MGFRQTEPPAAAGDGDGEVASGDVGEGIADASTFGLVLGEEFGLTSAWEEHAVNSTAMRAAPISEL